MNTRYEPIYVSNLDHGFPPPAPAPSESYVGAGWFKLDEDDILQEGDEIEFNRNEKWSVATCRYRGERAGAGGGCVRYRRRVTPTAPTDSEPVEIIADALHDPIAPTSGARIRSRKLQRGEK